MKFSSSFLVNTINTVVAVVSSIQIIEMRLSYARGIISESSMQEEWREDGSVTNVHTSNDGMAK